VIYLNRISLTLQIKPGSEAEYRRRHKNVWPELIMLLKAYGFKNYSIFLIKQTLFLYMECDRDIGQQLKTLHQEPLMIKWRDYMSDIIIRDHNMGFEELEEVFHID